MAAQNSSTKESSQTSNVSSRSSRRSSLAKRRLDTDAELEEGELPSSNAIPKHRRVGTSNTLALASCLRECGFTTSSTEDMCHHTNVAHTNELPPDSNPHDLARYVNAMISMRCPDGHSARFCDRCRTFFADSASAVAGHADACEGSTTHLARTGVDPRFGTFHGSLPLAAAGLVIEELKITTTELETVTLFALPGFPALVREEMGSVVELEGRTEGQYCFPLSVLRSHPVGAAAVASLPSGCTTAARLEALRSALSAQAVRIRSGLVQRANTIAEEVRGHAFDFATPGSGADVEMLHACAILACPLITITQLGPGRFSATSMSHPARPATAESPTALLFCEMRPATDGAPPRYHFQALATLKPADVTALESSAPAAPASPVASA
jgi:hypothetical protein